MRNLLISRNEEILKVKEHMWTMYFDGVSNQKVFRVSITFIYLKGARTLISVKLDFIVANNVANYEAQIIRLEVAVEIGVIYVSI